MQKFEQYKNWRLVVVPHKMLSFRSKGSFESNCMYLLQEYTIIQEATLKFEIKRRKNQRLHFLRKSVTAKTTLTCCCNAKTFSSIFLFSRDILKSLSSFVYNDVCYPSLMLMEIFAKKRHIRLQLFLAVQKNLS